VRKSLGRPRIFSENYVRQEREKLARYREIFRELLKSIQTSKSEDMNAFAFNDKL
jgi:hypothetical protein